MCNPIVPPVNWNLPSTQGRPKRYPSAETICFAVMLLNVECSRLGVDKAEVLFYDFPLCNQIIHSKKGQEKTSLDVKHSQMPFEIRNQKSFPCSLATTQSLDPKSLIFHVPSFAFLCKCGAYWPARRDNLTLQIYVLLGFSNLTLKI